MTDYLKDGERYRTLKDGTILKIARDEDVMQDRQVMRVPLVMLDGTSHQAFDASAHMPRAGVRPLNDRARVDMAHAMMVKRTKDAWRNPPSLTASAPAADAVAQPRTMADRDAAYKRRNTRLEDAWRGAK